MAGAFSFCHFILPFHFAISFWWSRYVQALVGQPRREGPVVRRQHAMAPMSDHDKLLHKARNSRALARRAHDMAHHLTQRADIERVRAYASELEALAVEMERIAALRISDGGED